MALPLIDDLILELRGLPATAGASTAKSVVSSSTDIMWAPSVPIGHTGYTWGNTGGTKPVSAPVSTPVPVSEPAPKKQKQEESKKVEAKKENQQKPQQSKKQKKQKQKQKGGKQQPKTDQPDISQIDIRVGKIVKAWKHPDADSLYCELIDIGEEQPRQVCSGLVNHIPHSEFEGSDVLCIVNLKPANMRGIKSYGMVLAAMSDDGKKVELVKAPTGSHIGERLSLEGLDLLQYEAALQINSKKKNSAWAKCAPDFKTNEKGVACYQGKAFISSAGNCKAKTLTNSRVS